MTERLLGPDRLLRERPVEEAHRLLCFVRDHAPEECRVAMIENVPLHRGIVRAHGAPPE